MVASFRKFLSKFVGRIQTFLYIKALISLDVVLRLTQTNVRRMHRVFTSGLLVTESFKLGRLAKPVIDIKQICWILKKSLSQSSHLSNASITQYINTLLYKRSSRTFLKIAYKVVIIAFFINLSGLFWYIDGRCLDMDVSDILKSWTISAWKMNAILLEC